MRKYPDKVVPVPRMLTVLGIVAPLVIGFAGLAAYRIGARRLVSPGPGWETMTPVGALLLIVAGAGLWLLATPAGPAVRRWLGRAAGGLVVAGAGAVLAEHVTGRSAGLDQLLFPGTVRAWTAWGHPGRPLPHTAAAFLLVGLTLLALGLDAGRGYRPAQFLASGACVVAGVSAVTPVLHAVTTLDPAPPGMPIPCIAGIAALSAGLVACRPSGVIVRVFRSTGPGGRTVRRIVATVGGVGIVAALAALVLPRDGGAADDMVLIAVTTTPLMILYLVLLQTGVSLDRAERQHRDLVRELREERDFNRAVVHSLGEGVLTVDAAGVVLDASPRWSELTGYPVSEVIGARPPYRWWPTDLVGERSALLTAALAGSGQQEYEGPIRHADGRLLHVLGTLCPVRDGDGRTRRAVLTCRDLTERHRDEAERRRMTHRLDHFFTMSHDLMCIAGTDGYFKQLNPAWERALGRTLGELTGRPYIELVHPDDRQRTVTESVRLQCGDHASVAFENRFRCADGSYRWLSWNATAVAEDGLVYAVARDFTAQHEADDSRARLAAIVNSTADAVIGKTLDGVIVSWNPAAERIYGYRADEALGQSISIIFPDDGAGQVGEILAAIARGETVKRHDAVRRRKDGGIVHLALTISPILDLNGNVVGAASIAHDVTGTKRAEERFHRLVLSAPDAMVIVDTDGLMLLVNEQAERMFGYEAGELAGRPVELLLPGHLRGVHVGHRAGYLAEPTVRNVRADLDLFAVRRDGQPFPVEVSLAPLHTDEGTLVAAAIRDITQRRQVQQALAAARDEALAAARAKSHFVAMVSHEIRTPMNGVIGLTNLLLDTPLRPVQQRYAESIRTSARALLAIINDILDFSKMEAGKVTLTDGDFDLGGLLDEVAYTVADAARVKAVEVLTSYPPELPAAVRGDAGRLRQVLLNLAGNAVKFTMGGEVVIRAEPQADAGRYTFSVSDTGIGIEPADLSRLFEPFTQADSTSSRQFGGTGLGLTISRQLVDLMGGALRAESSPGCGSRFSFTVALPAAERRPVTRDRLAGRRLLIVDGNETGRHQLARHARSWGMDAATTADGRDGIARLRDAAARNAPYLAVVIEQNLPDTTGTSLTREICDHPEIPTPTVVLLATTYSALPGTDGPDVLLKPVGPATLYDRLVEALDPHPHPHPAARGAAPAAPAGGRVLVAEDNEINQMVAVDTLAVLGYQADVAADGLEALELAAAGPYQAILMDCQMPRLDGFEATREFRRREPADHHTPVIAMTAGALAEDRQRCLDAGMDDYLTKPIDPAELRTALERWTHEAAPRED